MEHDFYEDLKMSYESCQLETDQETLKQYFENTISVEKTKPAVDKTGIDYYVKLQNGKKIGVDVKTRRQGVSRYWTSEPDLTIEKWSQFWGGNYDKRNKWGWTVDTEKQCDYIMYKFDKSDCDKVFIYPFHQLAKAANRNGPKWEATYGLKSVDQSSAGYVTKCVFVPVSEVSEAVKREFTGTLVPIERRNQQ